MKTEMKDIVNLCQNRWFVYAGSEIYGGLANTWDYGPYGTLLKENIKFLWQKEFIQKRTDMVALDAGILMNPQTWVASGHVGGFSDPLIDDRNTKERFRADKLLEDHIEDMKKEFLTNWTPAVLNVQWGSVNINWFTQKGWVTDFTNSNTSIKNSSAINAQISLNESDVNIQNYDIEWSTWLENDLLNYMKSLYWVSNLVPEAWPLEKQTEVMRGENIKNPSTWEPGDWTDAKKFNLMFQTSQWVTEDSSSVIYMRPETAQWIFVNFWNVLRSSRRKLPFGVAQVWKAFRNEITPGNFVFRTREFEQMEIEYFVEPGTDLEHHAAWKQRCMDFLTETLNIDPELLKMRDHDDDELSHYSNATTDIEFKFPFGWGELWGIADRTDFDLKAHMTESKQDLSYFDPVNNKKFIPYVIEPSVGLTRLFLAVLCDAYTVDGERSYLKLDPKLAPIKVWVLPVVKKIWDLAKEVYAQLSENFVCEYDEVGSVGKRYARMDEIGTPFCVTIDTDNYEAGNVTVRHRDSMEQEIVAISELNEYIRERIR